MNLAGFNKEIFFEQYKMVAYKKKIREAELSNTVEKISICPANQSKFYGLGILEFFYKKLLECYDQYDVDQGGAFHERCSHYVKGIVQAAVL
jgi:hypothetical protein